MNPEKRYGPIPINNDSELTEIAAESGMSLQELKEFLRVNHLGVFRPGSVPIAEEVTHSGKRQNVYASAGQQTGDQVLEGLKEVEAGDTPPHASVLAKWEAKART